MLGLCVCVCVCLIRSLFVTFYPVCACMHLCVCAKVSIPIMLKLRGSTILHCATTANHESVVRPYRGAALTSVESLCVCQGIHSNLLRLRGSTILWSYHCCKP